MLTSIKSLKPQPTGYRYCKTHVHCRYILTTQNREYTHRNHQYADEHYNHQNPADGQIYLYLYTETSRTWNGPERGKPMPKFPEILGHRKISIPDLIWPKWGEPLPKFSESSETLKKTQKSEPERPEMRGTYYCSNKIEIKQCEIRGSPANTEHNT